MLKKLSEYNNEFGTVALFKSETAFVIEYSTKTSGIFNMVLERKPTYDDAMQRFDVYQVSLKNQERKQWSR
ncbi:MAG: hypothetical protein K2M34_02195 [Alphaproteobacteria bacterium]|nr:hypothetical protein [Alphaproteobacteria bacterium]